ncbi:MAG TPA: OmpH family outer membrane protein [Gemmatimonadaceae bacterium]|nr:OmpH family outer membrane protein [Gemmatimonadaceae bacterium]
MPLLMRATLLALAFVAFPLAGAEGQGAQRFAYVNTQRLMDEAPGRAQAAATFEREMADYQATVQRMQDSLRVMVEAYQRQESTLTPEQREQRQQAIRTREAEYSQRNTQLQQQLAQRRDSLVQPLMELIERVLNDIRQEENFAMIFDVGAEVNVVVAADRNLDITDRALQRLKTMAATTPGRTQAQPPARPAGATPPPTGVTRPRPPQP